MGGANSWLGRVTSHTASQWTPRGAPTLTAPPDDSGTREASLAEPPSRPRRPPTPPAAPTLQTVDPSCALFGEANP
jgi:hypothetical protein